MPIAKRKVTKASTRKAKPTTGKKAVKSKAKLRKKSINPASSRATRRKIEELIRAERERKTKRIHLLAKAKREKSEAKRPNLPKSPRFIKVI